MIKIRQKTSQQNKIKNPGYRQLSFVGPHDVMRTKSYIKGRHGLYQIQFKFNVNSITIQY
jgi:hypothetical protein